jgi:subtilase family serine protease
VVSSSKWAIYSCILLNLSVFGFAQSVAHNRILQPVDDRQLTPVAGSTHPYARAEFDQGPADSGMKIEGAALVFKPSSAQQKALETLLKQQQDPTSPNYHKWLTPEEFADRFGMTQGDIAKVTSWLASTGLKVESVSRGRNLVRFTGTAAQMSVIFRTEFHRYRVNGETHFANATELSVPAAFSSTVLGFRNLDDFRTRPRAVLSHFTSNQSGNHFIAPDDLATIYDLQSMYTSGKDGTGQWLAVVGQSAIEMGDMEAFRAASGLTVNDPVPILMPGTGASTIFSGDEGESDLDLQWSGAVARNATILFVYTGNDPNFGVFDALQYTIDNNLAPVVSISYGNCESAFGSTNMGIIQGWAQQANAQGQTISAASGDSGAADCDFNVASATQGLAVDVPGVIPEITSVGGGEFFGDPATTVPPTDTTYWFGANNGKNGSARSYIPETSWNDTAICEAPPSGGTPSFCATGGGVSTLYAKPSYQTGKGVPNDGKRDVPDVSLNASPDHDGYLVCSAGSCTNGFRDSSGGLTIFGGTSAGAPTFSGFLALVNQAKGSNGLGNVNPTLYSLAASKPTAFHDITMGDNKVPCLQGSTGCPNGGTIGYLAGVGYDLVTGLGTIDGQLLVNAWPNANVFPSFHMKASPNTLTITHGQTGTTTVTVSSAGGFSGSVSLACSASSSTVEISCSMNPASVTVNANGSANSTLSVVTTAPHAVKGSSTSARNGNGLGRLAASFAMLLGAGFLVGAPDRKRRWKALLGVMLIAFLVASFGCGGGGGGSSSTPTDPGTPAGDYQVTVTSTAGVAQVTVTVQ